jgi:hypothetical protein
MPAELFNVRLLSHKVHNTLLSIQPTSLHNLINPLEPPPHNRPLLVHLQFSLRNPFQVPPTCKSLWRHRISNRVGSSTTWSPGYTRQRVP